MPIRAELRSLYPRDWPAISFAVRFELGRGRCKRCDRPHLRTVRVLPDGRWWDEEARTWRGPRGQTARWPDLIDATRERRTRVVLAAAHLDGNPRNNRWRNLSPLCQRCHMLHDRPQHQWARWVTVRRRYAAGDLFLGWYAELVTARHRAAARPTVTVPPARTQFVDRQPWRFRPDPRIEGEFLFPVRGQVGPDLSFA